MRGSSAAKLWVSRVLTSLGQEFGAGTWADLEFRLVQSDLIYERKSRISSLLQNLYGLSLSPGVFI